MADDISQEVYRQHRDAQSRYIYFLLAASGAAIAFSVSQTQEASLSWSMLPLGVAVLCWGLSFVCGCRFLNYAESMLWSNMELIKVERGEHPRAGQHPQLIQAASEGIRSALEGNSEVAKRYATWQFRFLIAGAVLFIIWHVLAMAQRNPQAPMPALKQDRHRPPEAASAPPPMSR